LAGLPVLSAPHSRRRRTAAEKVQIVKESLAPNVSIAAVALAHRINANQLHKWRWQFRQGKLVGQSDPSAVLLPVRVAKVAASEQQAPVRQHISTEQGYVEILIGETRVWVHGAVQAQTLRAVFAALSS